MDFNVKCVYIFVTFLCDGSVINHPALATRCRPCSYLISNVSDRVLANFTLGWIFIISCSGNCSLTSCRMKLWLCHLLNLAWVAHKVIVAGAIYIAM